MAERARMTAAQLADKLLASEHADVLRESVAWMAAQPRSDSARSRAALVDVGSTVLVTQPPEEASEFIWDGVSFSTAFFDCRADGTFAVQGRWSDWVFPPDSFGEAPGLLDGMPVPAMSVAGMLAMKEPFPTLQRSAMAGQGHRRYRRAPGTSFRTALA